ncbi:MAG: Kelch repeat-containing protein [Mucilaginibacter sp.]
MGFGLQSNGQGLQFNSNDSLLSRRTSYLVFKKDPPKFNGKLDINFDLSLWDIEHLGYILNITDTKNNSYSLSSIHLNNAQFLNFNIDSKSNKLQIPLPLGQLKRHIWMPVKIHLDLNANTVGIHINGKWYSAGGFSFDGAIRPRIYFGKNEHYSDVPKMAIRNLTVTDGDKSYTFPLNEWSGKDVFSGDGDVLGTVDNPVWLINESYFWAPRFTRGFAQVAGINFDEAAQRLVIFKSDSLISYDVQRNSISSQAYQNKCPVPLHLGKSIINTRENKLYAYETLKAPKQLQPAQSIATLDLNTLRWDVTGAATIAEQRHHHNIFYDNRQDKFYLFGGYGSFKYYNDFFEYNKQTDSWDKVPFSGDKIMPRFFSGFSQADANNDVYIFGGYGNQSGNQVVGGQHFYDLYRVNLTTHTIKKCWEIKPPAVDFVAANNLIISKDKQHFYAICYAHDKPKTSLSLYKFSIKDGSYEVVSGNIPAKGERIESDINLFYNPGQEVFYCTIQEFTSPDASTIRVYSLASPPVRQQDYLASLKTTVSHGWASRLPVPLWLVILIIIGAGAVLVYWKRKKKTTGVADSAGLDISVPAVNKKDDEKRANAVYMLGDFAVYDKNSRDITYMFSPKIKQLFILLLLNSGEEHGVVSKRIAATLWPEKEIGKTKNIKNVTINHLRGILADICGIELTFINDTYRFTFTEEFFCDYCTVSRAIANLNNHANGEGKNILDWLDLIARGCLLQHVPEPWLDDTKQQYEESLMPLLLPEVKRMYEEGDYRKTMEIARVILNVDPFNDIAIKYKLKALRRTKGIEFAHKIYNDFAAEYEKSLGEPYAVPFEKICAAK